jgi:MFS family permease
LKSVDVSRAVVVGSVHQVGMDLPPQGDEPNETELERWQRNFAELLQELRVVQTGVQILFAFLLTLAFSGRFAEIGTFERTVYLVALLAAAAATALTIAPVAQHRLLFRRGRKPYLVRSAHRMAAGGLSFLLVSMVSSVLLVTDLVLARPAAILAASVMGGWFVLLWGWAPWIQRRRGHHPPRGSGGTVAGVEPARAMPGVSTGLSGVTRRDHDR